MEFELAGRRAFLLGTDEKIVVACRQALRDEGVIIVEDVAGSYVDIVVAIAPTMPTIAAADLDALQLASSWEYLSEMTTTFRQVLPGMKARGWGRFIYVGSTAIKEITDDEHHLQRMLGLGALGLQKALSGEVGGDGVTCNNVLWASCLMGGDSQGDTLESVGAAVAYLASENAAYLTGITMSVDRAQSAGVF